MSIAATYVPEAIAFGAALGTYLGVSTFNQLNPTREHYEKFSAEACESNKKVAIDAGIKMGLMGQGMFLVYPLGMASITSLQRRRKNIEETPQKIEEREAMSYLEMRILLEGFGIDINNSDLALIGNPAEIRRFYDVRVTRLGDGKVRITGEMDSKPKNECRWIEKINYPEQITDQFSLEGRVDF